MYCQGNKAFTNNKQLVFESKLRGAAGALEAVKECQRIEGLVVLKGAVTHELKDKLGGTVKVLRAGKDGLGADYAARDAEVKKILAARSKGKATASAKTGKANKGAE